MLDGSCYEYASKIQFVRWLFDEILTLMHFAFVFLQNCAPRCYQKHILKIDAKQNALKNVSFESLLDALALSIPLRRALFRH